MNLSHVFTLTRKWRPGCFRSGPRKWASAADTKAPARLISMNYALDLGLPRRNLLDPEWRGQLSEILISGGYKLFFVDNIASLTPEIEENAKQAWDVINQWLLELRFRGISAVPLHHAGKSGAQRGTSGREDNVDTSILLKRPADYQVTDGCRFICAFEKDRCTEGRHLLTEYEFHYQNGVVDLRQCQDQRPRASVETA